MLVVTLGYGATVPNVRKWLISHPSVNTFPAADALFQQHANAFSTSAHGIGHLKALARLHATLEQKTRTNTLKLGKWMRHLRVNCASLTDPVDGIKSKYHEPESARHPPMP